MIYNAYGEQIKLTKEQEACVNYSGNKTLLVKGLAGSGKSIALMQLAKKLIEKSESDSSRIAFFSYGKTFCSAVKEFFEYNGGTENVTVTTLMAYITQVYNIIGGPKYKMYYGDIYDKKRKEVVQAALEEHRQRYGSHRFHNLDLNFWLDEIDWMKGMNVTTDDLSYYLTLPRKGRGGEVRMTALDRSVAFQIFTIYDIKLKENHLCDWDDYTQYIIRCADMIPEKYKFDYVLIDEAQDLSLLQMMAAKCFCRKNMVVAMDMNQRIYDKQWTPKLLGIETTTKKLTKSMRTTIQIDALAESIRSKNDLFLSEDDKSVRAVPERSGYLPKLIHFDEIAQEKKYLIEQIKAYLAEEKKYPIGIIAARKVQINTYAAWMTDAGIPHEIITPDSSYSMKKPGVKIVNVFNAKGLEFDRVIIPQFFEGNFPYYIKSTDKEFLDQFMVKCRNIIYVAMTRARQTLLITYAGNKGSRFIADMDPEFFEAIGNPVPYTVSTAGSTNHNPEVVLPPMAEPKDISSKGKTLISFFEEKGLEVVDKRPMGGALWVVGEKDDIKQYVKEAYTIFGAWGNYSPKGGKATKHKPGWFTNCKK